VDIERDIEVVHKLGGRWISEPHRNPFSSNHVTIDRLEEKQLVIQPNLYAYAWTI
jgi:hypothetical protein